MSMSAFMQGGFRGHLLTEEAYLPHILKNATIQVFDIGEKEFFGAVYPDTARIAVPRSWFPVAQRNYDRLKHDHVLFPPTPDGLPPTTPKIRLPK